MHKVGNYLLFFVLNLAGINCDLKAATGNLSPPEIENDPSWHSDCK